MILTVESGVRLFVLFARRIPCCRSIVACHERSQTYVAHGKSSLFDLLFYMTKYTKLLIHRKVILDDLSRLRKIMSLSNFQEII